MPGTDWGWQITPDELRAWTLERTANWLAVNKPAGVVCHPSKHGPWSSLVGAARQWLGDAVLHMPSRLDRETSGTVVLVRRRELAGAMQRAIQSGHVRKSYLAILEGELDRPVDVDLPLGRATDSRVFLKQAVRPEGYPAQTRFIPLEHRRGKTLVRVEPATGRLHQIRVHAAAIGHPVCGDKLYGPDETLFLEFLRHGMTESLRQRLGAERQMLHAERLEFQLPCGAIAFQAPPPEDLQAFWESLKSR
ncbi:MAG: RluA family pseudouridine synthase [Bryobacteraceae bacterium]